MIKIKLRLADYFSLAALSTSWLAIILLLNQNYFWAIGTILFAFVLDLTDGYVARIKNETSQLGRQLDSFIDVILYLCFSSILFYLTLSPSLLASFIVGTTFLTTGILRLINFNSTGFNTDENGQTHYQGLVVVHVLLIVLLLFFINQIFPLNKWFYVIPSLAVAFLQLSTIKTPKRSYLFYFMLVSILFIITLIASFV